MDKHTPKHRIPERGDSSLVVIVIMLVGYVLLQAVILPMCGIQT